MPNWRSKQLLPKKIKSQLPVISSQTTTTSSQIFSNPKNYNFLYISLMIEIKIMKQMLSKMKSFPLNLNALRVIELIAIAGCLIVLSLFFVEYVLL